MEISKLFIYLCVMQSEFEVKRELIYRLLKILGGVMEVSKNGNTTTWIWDINTQSIKRIK